MQEAWTLRVIAHVENDYVEKFGIPRQSGLVEQISRIVFVPEYRDANALRGLEGYSHLWLLWGFHANPARPWSPMVKPPRLGGNTRMGVFATRSPHRPNPIGLSSVRLMGIRPVSGKGQVLLVQGADLMNGTPLYDIKPYLPYTDSHPEAQSGFAGAVQGYRLTVDFPAELRERIPQQSLAALEELLAEDPRPAYQREKAEVYGLAYGAFDIRFRVEGERLCVTEVLPRAEAPRVK